MASASPTQSVKLDLKDRKILVVDDDRLNARILGSILKPEGYVVADADSGEAALDLYAKFQPDLVLLDVILPGINGFETCRRLKAGFGDNSAPVIFITAKHESDDVVEGLAAGGVDYLSKPFHPKEALARIRVHLQNRLLNEQQKKLVGQLSSANAAKNRLLGMAAHDLRNPLASIRGLAEFLCDGTVGTLSAEQLDLVNNIHDASQSMLTLVNELLDLSVIESGELNIHPAATAIVELLTKSVYLNNINAAKKGTRIELAATEPGRLLLLDADKVRQVVDNLLSNAIKFSPHNSIITVGVESSPRHYAVLVRDQGPGIPENERHKLFQDFGRLSAQPTGGEKSTGLGLAICKKIMESHQGSITAENLPDGGCEFRVTFPARMKFNGKILLADDEAHIRKFVGLILRKCGNPTILEASDGAAAVALFEQQKPDLVLLDVNMPNLDGVQTLERLMQIDPDVAVVIMLTSLTNRQTVEDCLRLGASGYIRKDTPREEMIVQLERIIEECFGEEPPPATP